MSDVVTGGMAVVTTTSPLEVRDVAATVSSPAFKLSGISYTPAVNDLVVYLRIEKQIVVCGKVV